MLEALLDILGELLGLGGQEPPPQQRPVRRALTRQPDAPQPPQSPQRAPDRMQQLRERLEERAREGKPVRRAARPPVPEILPKAVFTPAVVPGPAMTAVVDAVSAPVPQNAPDFAFIAALRSNPSAARQAFVYSEIFGKPLADRGSSF